MAVYFRGSEDGKAIKVGVSSTLEKRYKGYEKGGHRFINFPFPLVYIATAGGNDRDAETRIKQFFRPYLLNEARHGDEVFSAEAILPFVAWLRLQWFSQIDPSGRTLAEPVHYEDFSPELLGRRSDEHKEETLETYVESQDNPFWFLPDVSVEPNEDFYTPASFVEAVRTAFGGTIDVDPASHPQANSVVRATK